MPKLVMTKNNKKVLPKNKKKVHETKNELSTQTNSTAVNEIERTENKVGFFQRIINWFKSLFSRNKNTKTANGDAAQMASQTNVSADDVKDVSQDITNTLPPSVSDAAVLESPENTQTDVDENVEKAVDFGELSVDINEDLEANSGKVKVFGEQIQWTSQDVEVTKQDGKVTAKGTISIDSHKLKADGIQFFAQDKKVTFSGAAEGKFTYIQDGINIDFSPQGTFSQLDDIRTDSIEVTNRVSQAIPKGEFKGDFVIGTNINIEKAKKNLGVGNIANMPSFLQEASEEILTLENKTGVLRYGIAVEKTRFSIGNKGVRMSWLGFHETFGEIQEDGNIKYILPGAVYCVYALNNRFSKEFSYDGQIAFTVGEEGAKKIETDIDSFSLKGYNVKELHASGDLKTGDISFSVDSIEDEEEKIKITNAALKTDEKGIYADNAQIEIKYDKEKPPVKASLKNLNITAQDYITFDEAAVNVESLEIAKGVDVQKAILTLKALPEEISAQLTADLKIDVQKGAVKVKSEGLKIDANYIRNGEQETESFNLGSFQGKLEGEVSVGAYIGEKAAAEAKISNLSYKQRALKIGEVKLEVNAQAFFPDITATGSVTAKDISISSSGVDFSSLKFNLSEILYKGKPLADKIQGDLDSQQDSQIPIKVTGIPEKISIAKTIEAAASDLEIKLKTKQGKFMAGFSAESLSISYEDFKIEAKKVSAYFGEKIELGSISIANDSFFTQFEKLTKINAAEISAQDACVENDDIKFSGLSIKAASEQLEQLKLFDALSVKSIKVGVKTNSFKSFDALEISGNLQYSSGIVISLSGDIGAEISKDKFEFKDLENINIKLAGIGSGGFEKIEQTKSGFNIKKLTLKHENGDDSDSSSETQTNLSLLDKLMKQVPEFEVSLEKLTYADNSFVKPDKKDIKISKIKKEIKIGDHAAVNLEYDNGTITLGGEISYRVPDEREKDKHAMKEIASLNIAVPVVAVFPFLKVGTQLSFEAGFDAQAKLDAVSKPAEKDIRSFDFKLQADANADAKAAAGIGIFINFGLFKNELVLQGGGKIDASGNLQAATAINYKSDAKSLSDSFEIDRDKNSARLKAEGNLKIVVDLKGKAEIPSIFIIEEKKLMHSWELFSYDLGSIKFSGGVKREAGMYVFDKDFQFASALKDGKYELKNQTQILKEFDNKYDKLGKTMQELDEAIKNAFESKEAVGLGDAFEEIRNNQILDIQINLNKVIRESIKNSIECQSIAEKIRKKLEANSLDAAKAGQMTSYAQKVKEDSKKALDIAGVKLNDEKDKTELTKAKKYQNHYTAAINNFKGMLKDDEKKDIKKFSKLDPAAFFNMMKTYKMSSDKNWDDLRKQAVELSVKSYENNQAPAKFLGVSKETAIQGIIHTPENFHKNKNLYKQAFSSINKLSDETYKEAMQLKQKIGEKTKQLKETGQMLDKLKAEKKYTKNAEQEYDKQKEQLSKLKEQYLQSLKIAREKDRLHLSSQIAVGNDYISQEAKMKKQNIDSIARVSEIKQIDDEKINYEQREKFVYNVIDRVVKNYESKNGKKVIGSDEKSEKESERLFARINMINSGKIVDKPLANNLKYQDFEKEFESFTRSSKEYDTLNEKLLEFNDYAKNAMQHMEKILNSDYSSLHTKNQFISKSNEIKQLLTYVDGIGEPEFNQKHNIFVKKDIEDLDDTYNAMLEREKV